MPCMEEYCELFVSWAKIKLSMESKKIVSSFICNRYTKTEPVFETNLTYCFILEDGEKIWLSYIGNELKQISAPAEVKDIEPFSNWFDASKPALEKMFEILYPQGDEADKYFFLKGVEPTPEQKEEYMWIRNNIVYSEEGTRAILFRIGRWDKVLSCQKFCSWPGTGYKTYVYRLSAGGKVYEAWFSVTGPGTYNWDVEEVNLEAEKKAKREYYLKVKSLADEAGVPWKIAALLKDKDADRKSNVTALVQARNIHFSVLDDESVHELSCGISRRVSEICYQLSVWADMFALNGQVKTRRLADYLIGEQEDCLY